MSNKLRDPNSVANILAFTTKHIKVDWKIDFLASIISGSATLSLINHGTDRFVKLDCSHLNVHQVRNMQSGNYLKFVNDPDATEFGGLLSFELDQESSIYEIRIEYETTRQSSALQWLTPDQTVGRAAPYLFSQAQAIHARTMLPCQDTPAVKAPYSAIVSVPAPLSVVMSANRRYELSSDNGEWKRFSFEQTLPIPSYLIAIGAGAIFSKEIGPRSSIWSEKEILDIAADEFADTEEFIRIAESLVGPYVWERYDILLLPPSFPYGGMENPCLTFVTPSIICGDRSLVDVIAHEISHSWTGNLVSCMNWQHFWLNEGFTMFLERKILSRLHGESWRQFNSIIGLADLRESVAQFNGDGPATALILDLTSTNPDDVFSTVPYEKGYTLLYTLEELVGGPDVFEPFFKAYIEQFSGKSIVSEDFKDFFVNYFSEDMSIQLKLQNFAWDTWFYGKGMPPTIPHYSQDLLLPCQNLARNWLDGKETDYEEYRQMIPAQKVMFLDILLQHVDNTYSETYNSIDRAYGISDSANVEILLKWFLLRVRGRNKHIYHSAAQFATRHGRMKYCRPIFRELFKSDEFGRDLALSVFKEHQGFYHPIASQMIAKDLQLT